MQVELPNNFWDRVDKNGDCWLWIGSTNGLGYGEIRIKQIKYYVHRLLFQLTNGKIPSGTELDHLCSEPRCCNPSHLEAVDHLENVRRAAKPKPHLLKTHCIRGHDFYETQFFRKDGKGRGCRKCVNITSKNFAERKKLSNV